MSTPAELLRSGLILERGVVVAATDVASQAVEVARSLGVDLSDLLSELTWLPPWSAAAVMDRRGCPVPFCPEVLLELCLEGEQLHRATRLFAVWCAREALPYAVVWREQCEQAIATAEAFALGCAGYDGVSAEEHLGWVEATMEEAVEYERLSGNWNRTDPRVVEIVRDCCWPDGEVDAGAACSTTLFDLLDDQLQEPPGRVALVLERMAVRLHQLAGLRPPVTYGGCPLGGEQLEPFCAGLSWPVFERLPRCEVRWRGGPPAPRCPVDLAESEGCHEDPGWPETSAGVAA